MSTVIIIQSTEITHPDGSTELRPAIPFEQFPEGRRVAGPDESGRLVWFVHTEEE